jgi:toxin-antitoxin system PIN domain toxin
VIIPDANLLLYAYDTTCPFHEPARRWWEACLSGTEPVGLTHPVVFAFIRIGTSPRAFTNPMTLNEVSERVESWLERRITQVLHPDADHMARVLSLLTAAASAGGNLVTDAQIASLAMAHRAVVHTADRDFLRFPQLKCHYPLD